MRAWLRRRWASFKDTLEKEVYKALIVFSFACGLTALYAFRNFVSAEIASVLHKPPLEWHLPELIAVSLILAFAATLLILTNFYLPRKRTGKYKFLARADVVWKYNSTTGDSDLTPYRARHRVRMNEKFVSRNDIAYDCPLCPTNKGFRRPEYEFTRLLNEVSSLIEAEVNKHRRG